MGRFEVGATPLHAFSTYCAPTFRVPFAPIVFIWSRDLLRCLPAALLMTVISAPMFVLRWDHVVIAIGITYAANVVGGRVVRSA